MSNRSHAAANPRPVSELFPDRQVDRSPETGESRVAYDPESVPASLAVVSAVAAARDADPATLPSLYGVVDPDALDAPFDHPGRDGLVVRVDIEGCEVTVGPDRVLTRPE